jgi:hypothetical protein
MCNLLGIEWWSLWWKDTWQWFVRIKRMAAFHAKMARQGLCRKAGDANDRVHCVLYQSHLYLKLVRSLVLATVPNRRFGSKSWWEPTWNHCIGFSPIKTELFQTEIFFAGSTFSQHRTLAQGEYFSSDRITIWYRCKRFSFGCSFTSHSSICDPFNISWVSLHRAQFVTLFCSNSMNNDRIAIWRMGGERASKLHLLHVYHIVIRLKLKYLTGAEDLRLQKWRSAVWYTWHNNPWLCPVQMRTMPRLRLSGVETSPEPNRTVFPVETRTADGLSRSIAHTTYAICSQ